MRLVTLTRDMRPYQAGHDAALPDALAQQLLDAGDATESANAAASGLAPDAPTAPKRARPFGRNGYKVR